LVIKIGEILDLIQSNQSNYENWFVYRDPFNGFEDLKEVINWLKNYGNGPLPYVCVFPGLPEHWYWSLKYSLEGEPGYVLWGDKAAKNKGHLDEYLSFPFKNLVQSYEESHFTFKNNAIEDLKKNKSEVIPLIGLFYATHISQYLGFGLITDITLDAYRNFKGWSENEGAWILRWKMRVLWLDYEVIELLVNKNKINDPKDFVDSLKNKRLKLTEDIEKSNKLPFQSNKCLKKEDLQKNLWDILFKIINDDNEVNKVIELYRPKVAQLPSATIQALSSYECTPKPLSNELYKKAINDIKKELYINSSLDSKLAVAVSLGNVLFVGPPGVGKTSIARNFSKSLTGCEPIVEVANALWFRRDVIGGETLENGTVRWRSGFIIRSYNRAAEALEKLGNEDFLVFLIIDELNRADVDKAFGDFFAMFPSPHPEDWHIPETLVEEIRSYDDKIDAEAKKFLEYYGKHNNNPLKHLRVIATMNLVDIRNLFMVGEALTRRFSVVEIPCPDDDGYVDFLIERLSKEHKEVVNSAKETIKKVIDCARNKLKCIPPSAVKGAIELLARSNILGFLENDNTEKVGEAFRDYLLSSMGLLIDKDKESFISLLNNCLKQEGKV